MNRFSLASLRMRLVLLVLIGVIPALGFILYTGWTQRRLADVMMKDNAIRMVRLAALQQDQLIDGTRHLLLALAQLPEIRNRDTLNGPAILGKIQNENLSTYANFGLIDLNGEVVFSVVPFPRGLSLKDRAYFQHVLETQAFSIGSYQIGRITGKASINFGFPVYGAQGRLAGVIFTAVDLGWLSQMFADAQLPTETEIYVLEQNGTILARYPETPGMVGKRLPIEEITNSLSSQSEGTRQAVGADGRVRLFAFTDLGHQSHLAGLFVLAGIPAEIAYAEITRSLIRNLAGLALAAMMALVAAWYGGEYIILRRIRRLVAATRRLAGGDLHARTNLDYGLGEVGELARSFDEMAEALQTRARERERAERELRALNEVLELRVEERTEELRERTNQMEADLEMARELQEALIPHQQPGALCLRAPGGSGLQFFHRYHPTGKVGGDFFDVLMLPDSRAGVFICDVMGQGIRAALVTAIVRGLVEELKPVAHKAGEFVTQINRGLSAVFGQTGTPMFASAFYMIADPAGGWLEYANAGHPSPILVRQNSCEAAQLHNQNGNRPCEPALGLIGNFEYPTYQARIENGDLIILYTDGIYEVEGEMEEYGRARLLSAVQRRSMLPPILLFDELLAEIQQFSVTREFSDDVCLVGMQVTRTFKSA